MKKIFLLLLVSLITLDSYASNNYDVILTKTRQRIECYILKETDDVVLYMSKDPNDASEHRLSKSEILNIYYSDLTPKSVISQDSVVNMVPTTATSPLQGLTSASSSISPVLSDTVINPPVVMDDPSQLSTVEKTSSTTTKARIYRDKSEYLYNDVYISSKEVARILERDDPMAYKQWQKAQTSLIAGSVFCGAALGTVIAGCCLIPVNPKASLGVCIGGLVCCGVGLGCALSSIAQYEKAIDIYNKNAGYACTLNLHVSPTDVGFAFNF